MIGGAPFVLERVTQPDFEPITLRDMKIHLHEFANATSRDGEITDMIAAAREWAEDYTGRALVDQTWRLTLGNGSYASIGGDRVSGYTPGAPGFGWFGQREWAIWMMRREIMLRKSPILEVVSFVSVDQAGVETAVDPATYELREAASKWPRIVPLNGIMWPTSGLFSGFRVTFRAGHIDTSGSPSIGAVPVRFLTAMKLFASGLFDEDPIMLPLLLKTAEQILKPERSDLSLA